MSEAVIEMLARRWNCSTADVRRTLVRRLEAHGVVDTGCSESPEVGERPDQAEARKAHIFYTLGVTDDDRVFVLDENDQELFEL